MYHAGPPLQATRGLKLRRPCGVKVFLSLSQEAHPPTCGTSPHNCSASEPCERYQRCASLMRINALVFIIPIALHLACVILSQVLEVEEEMRELLRDTAQTKKVMEDKVKKLTRAFTELQDDLL